MLYIHSLSDDDDDEDDSSLNKAADAAADGVVNVDEADVEGVVVVVFRRADDRVDSKLGRALLFESLKNEFHYSTKKTKQNDKKKHKFTSMRCRASRLHCATTHALPTMIT